MKRCDEQAATLLREAGAWLTAAVRNRLTRTLGAAAADPALRSALREGRVRYEITSAGFDVFGAARPLKRVPPPPAEPTLAAPAPAPPTTPKPDREQLRRVMRARTTLEEARAALHQAQAHTARLTRMAADAQQRADQARRAAEQGKAEEEVAARRVAEAERALRAVESANRS